MQETVVIVPSFNPDEKFLALLDRLRENGFLQIVAVNDGSRADCDPLFAQARKKGAVVLEHAVNQGKGRALKTAFHYVLKHFDGDVLAVCADADGQHAPEDIRAVGEALAAHPGALVLGCRQFSDPAIPARSRYGNRITRFVFRTLCGVRVSDTQTGLRGLSADSMRSFLSTAGERFEYEMNMLIDAKEKGIPIVEVPIHTIYIEENRTSHFNPLRDSLRIYAVFAKFLASSLTSSAVDLGLFWGCSLLLAGLPQTAGIFLATLIARVVSSLTNYAINKNRVFRLREGKVSVLVKYYLLCGIQLLCSAALVDLIAHFVSAEEVLIKIPVDLLLFFLSFQLQREWVFRREGPRG